MGAEVAVEPAAGPQVGELLRPFIAWTADGRRINRHEYKGRRHLVLFFLHAADCPQCRALFAALAAQYAAYQAEGAEVLAVLPGDEVAAVLAGSPAPPPFPLLLDADGRIGARYGARTPDGAALPALFVADRYGEVVVHAVVAPDPAVPLHGLPLDQVLPALEWMETCCFL